MADRACLLSGDDSGLKTVWEEICVQLQFEYSSAWDVYEGIIYNLIHGEIEELAQHELVAVWFQTGEGIEWCLEDDADRREGLFIDYQKVTEYILRNYLYEAAENWSNKRVRKYLDRYS